MIFIIMRMKNNFHIKGWALNLVLIQRPGEILIGRCFGSEIGVGKSGWFLALASLFQALRLEGLASGWREKRNRQNQTKTRLWGNGREDSQIHSPQFPLCFSLRPQDLWWECFASVSLAMDSCQICILQSDNKKIWKIYNRENSLWILALQTINCCLDVDMSRQKNSMMRTIHRKSRSSYYTRVCGAHG